MNVSVRSKRKWRIGAESTSTSRHRWLSWTLMLIRYVICLFYEYRSSRLKNVCWSWSRRTRSWSSIWVIRSPITSSYVFSLACWSWRIMIWNWLRWRPSATLTFSNSETRRSMTWGRSVETSNPNCRHLPHSNWPWRNTRVVSTSSTRRSRCGSRGTLSRRLTIRCK